MEKTILDFARIIMPLSKEKKQHILALKKYLNEEELKYVKQLLKLKRIGISYEKTGVSKELIEEKPHPEIHLATQDKEVEKNITLINEKIIRKAKEENYKEFSKTAHKKIPELIAPQIRGFEEIKKTISWQLFCPEIIHVLLLGDPGTGKTEMLISTSQLAPISSYGLGSGTSGVGLTGAMKGKKFIKGLLPLADKGICCIDELNLMKPKDRGALLNAMEKGFVTYDKGTSHKKLSARVRIQATANPKGDRFIGTRIDFLKEQIPFDPALLSRFHMVFLIRKPDVEEFVKITKSIIRNDNKTIKAEDIKFIKEYIVFAEKIKVEFDKKLEPIITSFVKEIKKDEKKFLIEISPRFVIGIIRMSKAAARIKLKEKVTEEELREVIRTVRKSLYISPDKKKKRE